MAFGFCWLLATSIGFLASVCFFAFVGLWRLLAVGFLALLAFGLSWLFGSVGYSIYRRMTRNYIEMLPFGLHWLQVIFASSSCCCCCFAGGGGGGGSSRGFMPGGAGAAPSPTPPSFEISDMKFCDILSFVFVVVSSCLLYSFLL